MKKTLFTSGLGQGIVWLLFSICLIIFSLGISWKISASINMNYSMWYDVLEINKTIEKYSVQNKFGKKSFIETNKAQHVAIFEDILTSVTNSGAGLKTIRYTTSANQEVDFLTLDEVIHLQDVSTLIDRLTVLWFCNCILLCIFCFSFRATKMCFPDVKTKTYVITLATVSIVALLLVYGFTPVFYYLHTLVFPDDHQWFFYYQDSLMSTLMQAPDLFGVLGLMLTMIGLVVYILVNLLLNRLNIVPR